MQLFVAVKQLNLKAARTAKKLTQEKLAQHAGVNKGTVSRIEAGEILNPSNATVAALEQALKLRRGTLVFGHFEASA